MDIELTDIVPARLRENLRHCFRLSRNGARSPYRRRYAQPYNRHEVSRQLRVSLATLETLRRRRLVRTVPQFIKMGELIPLPPRGR